jgi:hypothetical protein
VKLALLCLAAFAGAVQAAPDVRELLTAVQAAEAAQEGMRARYVYRERVTNRDVDERGNLTSGAPRVSVYEHIFLEGAPYRQLVERNGKPLSGAEQAKRAKARQEEAKRRQEARRRGRFLPGTRNVRLGKAMELLEHCDARIRGEEAVDGHPTWVVEVTPRAGRTGRRDEPGGEISAYRQTLWVHQREMVVVRREATVLTEESEILPGSVLTFQFAKPEGQEVWFPARNLLTFGARNFGVRTYRGRQEHEYSDFRRFDVESTITVVEPPK